MFKAKLKDAKFVKGLFEVVTSIISESRLKVDPVKGLFMTSMDGSHICCVDLHLAKEDFDEFECSEPLEMGLNFIDLLKILKRTGPTDAVHFASDDAKKRFLIEFKSESSKKTRKFNIAMIDNESEEINMESLNGMQYPNQCSLNVSMIDDALKDAEIFSEVLSIKVKDKLIFSTEGTIGDMEFVLEKDELADASFTAESEGFFAIQFLKNIIKTGALVSTTQLGLGHEMPFNAKFKLLEHSQIQFFQAPRVEEDTDAQYQVPESNTGGHTETPDQ